MNELKVHANEFESFAEAEAARKELPFCGGCKSRTKIQFIIGRWVVKCMKNRQHFGMWNGVSDK